MSMANIFEEVTNTMEMDGVFFVLDCIQKDVDKPLESVANTVALLEGGSTIPFISRYRKEKTGNLDEIAIRKISERYDYYKELEERKAAIIKSIDSQGKLTEALKKKILECVDKVVLEDMYLPYKPKKRTRASTAKEKGLEPLAEIMVKQETSSAKKEDIVAPFINKELGVEKYQDAINGAKDIIAERIADSAGIRGWVRNYTAEEGVLKSAPREEFKDAKTKFSTYYETSEKIKIAPSHRLLAVQRGTKEEVLTWKIVVDELHITNQIKSMIIKNPNCLFRKEIEEAAEDSYSRLMEISIAAEVFVAAIKRAETEAIDVFSKNLRNLLLAAPAGPRITIGIDPGFRTGCKVSVVDEKGDFKEFAAIYQNPPERDTVGAEAVLMDLIEEYEPELIVIGNGTASKETLSFVKDLLKKHKRENISCLCVSEAGASVYSASENAGKEFPDLDVTVRGAISIARRTQDPLAELVKIDPKAIGVGQYQHDVNQRDLKKSLDLTVESCVNYVGVDLNTASVELLSYVSGIGRMAAENVVKYRSDNGLFKNRQELKKVSRLTDKAFEQCAGFLRIRKSDNLLDNSSIHPEAYPIVEKMARDKDLTVDKLIGNAALVDSIPLDKYVTETIGLLTLKDIATELKKPGRDPRQEFKGVEFSTKINELEDLSEGMVITGVVTNVTNFGVFVDVGVHQDGLIHISNLADSFIKNPYEVVSVGDTLQVEVLEVDTELNRIAMKRISGGRAPDSKRGTGGKKAGSGGPRRERNTDSGFNIGSYLESSYKPPK
jgi:uncharacterized protein